jgi:HK97 family phage major capsid protein
LRHTLEEVEAQARRLEAELDALRCLPADGGRRARIENVETALAAARAEIADRRDQLAHVRMQARDPHNCASGDGAAHPERKKMSTTDTSPAAEAREAAHRAVDGLYERGGLSEAGGYNLVDVIDRDKMGAEARYIRAVAAPEYMTAWRKKVFGVNGAEATVTSGEQEALAEVGRSMSERAMLAGEDAKGGFALPAQIDPTFQLSSDGALSPLRQLANVTTTSAVEWRGVTTEGTTAEFAKEGEEVGDGTPTLEQPKIRPERAHAFVPFSFEISQDLGSLNAELTRLFSDAKDVLEADKFLYGSGEDEPFGLLNEVDEGSVLETKTKEKLEVGDVYTVIEKLPPRWQGRASWLSSLTIANVIHRFSGPGSEEAPLFNEDRTKLLGKAWLEISGMSVKSTTAKEQILLYGDIGQFRIVDRLGMSVSTIPHLFGEEGRPVGMSGLYVIWRTSSAVQIPNALRVLTVKA